VEREDVVVEGENGKVFAIPEIAPFVVVLLSLVSFIEVEFVAVVMLTVHIYTQRA